MAKIQTYKFVNPGVAASASPAVAAARTQTLALNRLGSTVSSIASLVSDIEKISIAQIKNDKVRIQAERRAERRRLDAAAEESSELKKTSKEKPKLTSQLKRVAKGSLGWLETFLAPLGKVLLSLASFALTQKTLEYLADENNLEKITTFFEKATFVFNKLKEFAENIGSAIGKGLDFIFGKETTIEERLNAFGKIAMAIGGIAGMIAAAGGIRDLLDAGDSLTDIDGGRRTPKGSTPDGKPVKPPKPTPTNPSGADPDIEGPRGRPSANTVKGRYGDAAEAAYKKILKERGEDAARAFLGELENSGGSVTKAQQRFNNRYIKKGKFKKIEPPKPSLASRVFGGIQDLGKKGLSLVGQGLTNLGKGALEQFNKLSNAGKTAWNNTVAATNALKDNATKWAAIQGDKFKKGAAALGERAKNALFQKVLEPLRPIIDPIAKKAKQIGELIFENLKKIPGFEKVLKFLKQKGIDGLGAIATAGKKLGNRAGAIIPVVGGLVNLAFAYDRAANGDSIGALLEGTSGILDIAGLFTGGTTSGVSMLIDGYMFARDFIPQLQEGENAVINRLGVGGFKSQIDAVLGKLPNLGEIIGMITGGGDNPNQRSIGGPVQKPQEMFLGGVVKGISNAVSSVGKAISGVVSNPIVQGAASLIPGAGPIMAGIGAISGLASGNPMAAITQGLGLIPGIGNIMSGPIGQIATNLVSGNFGQAISTGIGMFNPAVGQLAGSLLGGGFNPASALSGVASQFGMSGLYNAVTGAMGGNYADGIRELGGQLGVDPKVLGAVEGTTSKIMSKDGLSAQYAMQQALEFVPVPMILEKLVPLPTPVPINTGGAGVVTGIPSSLTQRTQ